MKNFFKLFRLITTVSLSFSAFFLIVQNSANAIVFDWQFNGEGGNSNVNLTGTVSGTVEFQDSSFIANQTVSATNLMITNAGDITGSPFFGSGYTELNTNLVSLSGSAYKYTNSFTVNSSANGFDNLDFDMLIVLAGTRIERFALSTVQAGGNAERSFLHNYVYSTGTSTSFNDSDSSTLSFTPQVITAAVPFEFSPTLGLLLVGSISSISYFRRKN